MGFLSSFIAGDLRGKYEALNLPPLSPPGWLFGVVWPILYVMMGVALFLIITAPVPSQSKTVPLVLFAIQLALNVIWSPVFFRGDMFWAAFVIILLLDIALIACMITFFRIHKVAGVLLVPYALWLLFATYLNAGCAILN